MKPEALIRSLEASGRTLAEHVAGLSDEQARFRPADGKWSALEVLGHLVDEERLDFRARVTSTLEDPARAWPPIDPQSWALERDYQGRDLREQLTLFRTERTASLGWLRSLVAPDWSLAHEHPKLGALRAGDLLAAWATHDLLHLRQLAGLRLAWLEHVAPPFSTRYAQP